MTRFDQGLPAYDELPVLDGLNMPHAWDFFGREDNLGSINFLTPSRVKSAASLVHSGEMVNLSLPFDEPAPPLFGREAYTHDVFSLDRNTLDDRVDSLYMQASSQWDGLRHIRAREFGYFTGITEDFRPGRGRLGIEHWVEHGIAGCGVLLDVAAYFAASNRIYEPLKTTTIMADDLEATAEYQGVSVEPGDLLCIHFGWIDAYRSLSAEQRATYVTNVSHAGLEGSAAMTKRLWDWHVAAVLCDNTAVEVVPGDPAIGSLHRRMIPLLGMAFGEMFDFSVLREKLRTRGSWRFMFTAAPLHVPGAIGSPANVMAIL
tara:strand:- start:2472 stop:3422 length:951 start_codon:yes stop_codon:yes gene_type:complete